MSEPIFTKKEYEVLVECVIETISMNRDILECLMFGDDIEEFYRINEYDDILRKIRFKLDDYKSYLTEIEEDENS